QAEDGIRDRNVTGVQTCALPILEDPAFLNTGLVFTIHNMGYQGLFPPEILPLLMLPWDLFTIAKMEYFGNVNFLKGALAYADMEIGRASCRERGESEVGDIYVNR